MILKLLKSWLCFAGLLAAMSPNAWSAQALGSPHFNYQGRLFDDSGTTPLREIVDLTFTIYNPDLNCVLYEETQTEIDLIASKGYFSVLVGSGLAPSADASKRSPNDPGKSMIEIFSNASSIRAPDPEDCPNGYTPEASDPRKLRVTVTPQSSGIPRSLSPDLEISSVPQAHIADTLQGLDPSHFVQIVGNSSSYTVSKSAMDVLFGTGGSVQDASSLHHHDSLYAKLTGSQSISLSSDSYLGLGVHGSDPDTTGWNTDASKTGRTWFDSGTKEIKYWDGTAVRVLGTTVASGFTAADLLPATAFGTTAASDVTIGKAGLNTILNGKVGVGVANPAYQLDVAGDVNVTGSFKVNGVDIGAGGGGTVTSVSSANADIGVSQSSPAPVLTLNSGTGANQIVKLNGSSELPAVSGANLTNLPAGNVSGRVSLSNLPTGTLVNDGFPLVAKNGVDPAFQSLDLASSAVSGTLAAGRFPALSGDVTTTAGSLSTTITDGAVTDAKVANGISASKISGDITGNAANVTGTVAIAHGGTGATDATSALNALLPSQATNSGKFLKTDGTNVSWSASPGSQWTDGASSSIYYTAGNVGIGTTSPNGKLSLGNSFNEGKLLIYDGGLTGSGGNGYFSSLGFSGNVTYLTTPSDGQFSIGRYTASNMASRMSWVFIDNSGRVGIGTTSPASTLDVKGNLTLTGATSGAVALKAPASGGTATFTLPADVGTSGQALTTDGTTGALSWTTISSADATKLPLAGGTMSGDIAMGGNNISGAGTIAATTITAGGNDVLTTASSLDATKLSGRASLSNLPVGTLVNDGFPLVAKNGVDPAFQSLDLASSAVSGTLAAGRFPALSGDVTTTAGSLATTIADGAVTDAKVATGISASKISGDITGNAANVTGTVAIAHGGTGATDATSALNALLPSQATNSGKFLKTDGTNVSWSASPGSQWTDGASSSIYYTAGNVGIGTTAPESPLEVAGIAAIHDIGTAPDNAYAGALKITRASNAAQYINLIRAGSYPWSIGMVPSSNTFGIGPSINPDSSFSPNFTMTTTGNVGIGTTSPQASVHISNGTDTITRFLLGEGTAAGEKAAAFSFDPAYSNGLLTIEVQKTGTGYGAINLGPGSTKIGLGEDIPGSKLSVKGNATIGSSYSQSSAPVNGLLVEGTVGIGTSSPAAKFHLAHAAAPGTVSSSGTTVTGAGTTFTTTFAVGDTISAAGQTKTISAIANDTSMTTSDAFSPVLTGGTNYNRIGAILDAGYVGIGTASPHSPLHVITPGAARWSSLNKPTVLIESAGSSNTYYALGVRTATGDALAVTNAGNVGIGTTSPVSPLDIATTTVGTVWDQVTGAKITTGGGSGYALTINNVFGVQQTGNLMVGALNGGAGRVYAHGNSNGTETPFGGHNDSTGANAANKILFRGRASDNSYQDMMHITSGKVDNNAATFGSYLSFGTATNASVTEKMRIDNLGRVGIGNADPSYKLDVSGDVRIDSASKLYIGTTAVCDSTGCTASPSDARYKEDVEPLSDALDRILKLDGVSYSWRDKATFNDRRQIGFIAQDVEKVYPEVVKTDEKTGFKSVMYDKLVAPIIEAIKSLSDKISSQDRKIASLQNEQKGNDQRIRKLKEENAELRKTTDAMRKALCEIKPDSSLCKQ